MRAHSPLLRAAPVAALIVALGAPLAASAQDAATLRRFERYEAEMARLVASVEELQFALRTQREEMRARIDDLELRIIELEGGDPLAAFSDPANAPPPAESAPPAATEAPIDLGGAPAGDPDAPPVPRQRGAPPAPLGVISAPAPDAAATGAPDAADRAALNAALAMLKTGGVATGAASVEAYLAGGPPGPLAAEAHLALGEAYAAEGAHRPAARQFVAGLRADGSGPYGPEMLLGLADSLAALGQTGDACAAIAEFGARFPNADPGQVLDAEAASARHGCG